MKKLNIIIIMLLLIFSCKKSPQISPTIELEFADEAYLEKVDQISLKVGTGPVLGMVQFCVVTDSAIWIADGPAKLVCQYNFQGDFVKTIGGVGNGPGEYLLPNWLTTDKAGRIYILDRASLRLNVYAANGEFIENILSHPELSMPAISRLFVGDEFNLIILGMDSNGIPELTKIRRSDFGKIYSRKLASPEYGVLAHGSATGFYYDANQDRIYFILASDYHVQEIDGRTGEMIRVFGKKPDDYTPLEDKYLGIKNPDRELQKKIIRETSCLYIDVMMMIGGKFLLTGFRGREDNPLPFLLQYDISSRKPQAFDVYWFPYDISRLSSKNNYLYSFKSPMPDEMESINGTIDVLTVEAGIKPDKVDLKQLIRVKQEK